MNIAQLTVAAVLLCCGHLEATKRTITLDPYDKYNLTWHFNSTEPSDYVTFTIECETKGWVGIGMSPNGGMAGADLVVGWVDSSGVAHLKDMHAAYQGLPTMDKSQDVELVSASESSGKTTITFRRKIHTCDDNDRPIQFSTTRLIYAYGDTDPTDNILSGADKHSNKGAKSVYLLDAQPQARTDPKDGLHFDMRVGNYEVRNTSTTYHCSFYDAPSLRAKHHIVSAEPLVTPGNEGIVHHIVVYACLGVDHKHIRNNNKTEGVCHSPEMPEFHLSCRNLIYAWAVGGEKFYLPEHAGIPLGENDSALYYMMEIHYDNSQQVKGRLDSSGIRMTYTPSVRKDDIGLVAIGDVQGIFVPPKVENFRFTAYCHSDCTNKWVPETGVNFVAYFLHAHLLGTAIQVEWYRDGKAVGVLAKDDHYDFNYQEYRLFESPQRLMPGDTLKITCIYNSMAREKITYGGEETTMEMCLAFIMYYPKQKITFCNSSPKFVYSNSSDLYSKLSVKPRWSGGARGYIRSLDGVSQWNDKNRAIAQDISENTERSALCIEDSGTYPKMNTTIDPAKYPAIKQRSNKDICEEQRNKDVHGRFAADNNNNNNAGTIVGLSCIVVAFGVFTTSLL